MSIIYEDRHLFIEVEKSEIPWLKVFTKEPFCEFSDVPFKIKLQLLSKLDIIERELISYYKPKKINIASFGNYMPHVHFHIMARFENDSYFPDPMWGKKQRVGSLDLPSFDEFIKLLLKSIDKDLSQTMS